MRESTNDEEGVMGGGRGYGRVGNKRGTAGEEGDLVFEASDAFLLPPTPLLVRCLDELDSACDM